MEDIEKEIAGEEEIIEKEKEDDTIKFSKRGSNNDKKRNIIITILIALALILIGVILVLALGKKDEKQKDEEREEVKEVVKDEETEEVGRKLSYVSCDDNTTLLNVRNSSTGDIIDGLSCFKEVKVLEEIEGTDNCDKWYRVSYDKRGNSYTGYVCSKYIKESTSDSLSIKKIKETVDKANKYYEDNQALVYCGDTNGTKTVQINTDGHSFEGQYAKSEFKTIDELKTHILSFLDESLIKVKLELADYNNPKMYDNYYEIDGNLYCRNYSGKGWNSFYTGNYDVEVINDSDNKIQLKIAYEYIDEDKLADDTECSVSNISKCPNSYFKYIIKNITMNKEGNNYIITKIDFHE